MSAVVVAGKGQFSDRESVLDLAKEFGVKTTVRCHSSDNVANMGTQAIRGHIIEGIISRLESDDEEVVGDAIANLEDWVDVVGYNNITADKLYRLGTAHYSVTGSIRFALTP